jgi:hypothetical protein
LVSLASWLKFRELMARARKLAVGLFDGVFHPQPVEQRALGLLLAGGYFDRVPSQMGSASFHL